MIMEDFEVLELEFVEVRNEQTTKLVFCLITKACNENLHAFVKYRKDNKMNNFFPKWNQDRIVYSWQNDKLRIGADDNDVLEIKGNSIFWSDFISCCDGNNSIKDIQKTIEYKIYNFRRNNYRVFR
ncbi:hypothetical protein [Streptococcus equi]|uniref:hypothetical protein n=1 Tax=Streptococcus equi TaxID=1336 RepID=UPI001E2F0C47|nr:hypothetical protein [Streptococcus equi]